MKKLAFFAAALLLLASCGQNNRDSRPENLEASLTTTNNTMKNAFYDFTLNTLDGKPVNFADFKGKKVLLVNVASKCGYTPQYADLQKLHEQYKDKVIVLGFPANNFGKQEPGSNTDIKEFCSKNYGVTFTVFEKISVTGDDQHPLYKWLSSKDLNGWNDKAPSWNFCKYLVNEKGELVKFFGSGVKPFDKELVDAINQ